jgi:hypothetical protein
MFPKYTDFGDSGEFGFEFIEKKEELHVRGFVEGEVADAYQKNKLNYQQEFDDH